jgi:hypothetical protein
MPNVTLSMDHDLLVKSRAYARRQHTTLNSMIRQLVQKTVTEEQTAWVDECFQKMNEAGGDSKGQSWKREDLYDV